MESIVININPEDKKYPIYHPSISEIANKEIVQSENSDIPKIDEKYLCMSCDQLIINPEECSICKVKKCKECESICFHTENYYKPIEIPELKKLKFNCVNGCNNIIPYDLIIKHYEFMCPKFNYKLNFEKIYKEYKETEYNYNTLKNGLDKIKKEHSQILRNKIQYDSNSNTVKINAHRHELTYQNSNGNLIYCSNCNKTYINSNCYFICNTCDDYTLCSMCFVLFTTK